MSLHDYELLRESMETGRQNEAAARRREEEGAAEVEEVDEEALAPAKEADTQVRLTVRFKDGDRPMIQTKMKFGRVCFFSSTRDLNGLFDGIRICPIGQDGRGHHQDFHQGEQALWQIWFTNRRRCGARREQDSWCHARRFPGGH